MYALPFSMVGAHITLDPILLVNDQPPVSSEAPCQTIRDLTLQGETL